MLFLPAVSTGINPGLVFNIAVTASSSVIGNGSGGK
ncbi:hypothetical protein B576_25975 [Salmonella enterica subsp. enterica serovar Typhimurium str. STm8]|nr:hypothetical protein B576_25975 [Salmonella enterica subsp. enterica serovar Typhimurium str. STm8]EQM56952.1 hypothetical protein B574_26580 [Salmonella enterica subsp. enterica serovar Typhimurium str. STm4]EQM57534.1 hypothetical protein B575_25330 [Salmonella enterica subsp. enterica serovar Typhimurium str. STm6]